MMYSLDSVPICHVLGDVTVLTISFPIVTIALIIALIIAVIIALTTPDTNNAL